MGSDASRVMPVTLPVARNQRPLAEYQKRPIEVVTIAQSANVPGNVYPTGAGALTDAHAGQPKAVVGMPSTDSWTGPVAFLLVLAGALLLRVGGSFERAWLAGAGAPPTASEERLFERMLAENRRLAATPRPRRRVAAAVPARSRQPALV
jgi:hypothetical protein